MRRFYLFLLILVLFASESRAQHVAYELFLIGDAGEPPVGDVGYKATLARQLEGDARKAVVFLGDNVYPRGLGEPGNRDRDRGETILKAQIRLAGDGKYPVFFLPGNHDWKRGRRDGWDYIRHQQQFIDSLHRSNVHFYPQGGCPGPVEISLTNDLTIVILDTQWLLQAWSKPEGEKSSCDTKSLSDIIAQLDDILRRNAGKRVVIAAHHPVYTYGEHGGVYTLKQHIFPLTDFKRNAWLPLPVLGSIYPLYRKVFGDIQDTAHPIYREYVSAMTTLLKNYPGAVYAAGHEHTLQYSTRDSVHYIVSGAGSKTTPVKKKGYAKFAVSKKGFVRLKVMTDGTAAIEYFSGDQMIFQTKISAPVRPLNETFNVNQLPDSAVASASDRYTVGATHQKWWGKNYRDVWGKKISAEVFDIGSEKGGLKIIQRGGGFQTLSLRLKDSLGREFTLRSIEKFPAKAIPEAFRNTFAEAIVQDQISASHPYGAIVVPSLAQAAGIYHTNPKVVYIPDDPRLGIYRRDISGMLMLFEERPSGNRKDIESFGHADKIIGIDKLIEKLGSDNDNRVDQEFTLRNRLFDMWIGDWDRHDDQWRWAEFNSKKGNIYRPIPRDRDQAFFLNEGRIPPIFSRKWILPKFEGFKDSIRWPSGLMFNGRYFDRNFLTELSRDQWVSIATELSEALTDAAIDSALRHWPSEIYKLHGEEIARKLRSRRKKLVDYALGHYQFLAREVSVVGSNQKELFEVTQNPNGNVLVEMFKFGKGEKGRKLYSREFANNETREVRLFGLGGDDRFDIARSGESKIKVRVIGGDGKDDVEASDASHGDFVYDKVGGVVMKGRHLRDLTSNDPKANAWDRLDFLYDQTAPLVYFNSNIDDGLFIGGGALITRQGFRKTPFSSRHLLLGSVAINTLSFNFRYDGRFTNVIGKWNLELDADIKSPNYVNNFFGLGNQSVFNQRINEQPGINLEHSIQYYRMRFKEYDFEAKMGRSFGSAFFKVGPAFQRVGIEDPGNKPRYIKEYANSLPAPLLEVGRNYGGLSWGAGVDKRNSLVFPTRGVFIQETSRWMAGLSRAASGYSSHQMSMALYQSFRIPAKVTFAFRATAGKTFGNYQLYQAQILDGRTEIRGYRKTRFYGDSKLVFNNEIRLKLGSFRSYLFPASVGLTGFYDIGRVWYKDQNGQDPTAPNGRSTAWHHGAGGGIWLTPFGMAVVAVEIASSGEETLGYLRLGFLF